MTAPGEEPHWSDLPADMASPNAKPEEHNAKRYQNELTTPTPY